MIASKAMQLKAVTVGDDEAIGELIRSKLLVSGFALPGDMEDGFIAGLKEKMASQQVGMSAASRSKYVAEMLAKLKGKFSVAEHLVTLTTELPDMPKRNIESKMK